MTTTLNVPNVPTAIRLCLLDDIAPGLGRVFHVAGQEIAVFRSRCGRIQAMENRCPHRNGPLAEGMLAGNRVVCPLHGFRFSLASGQCDEDTMCNVKLFSAYVQDGAVMLEL